jgi:hypothetical protein
MCTETCTFNDAQQDREHAFSKLKNFLLVFRFELMMQGHVGAADGVIIELEKANTAWSM